MQIPEPDQLKNRFLIPRPIVELMIPWFGLSESLVYKMMRQERIPSTRTATTIEERTGVPTEIWNEPVDIRIEKIYTIWYEQQKIPEVAELRDIF